MIEEGQPLPPELLNDRVALLIGRQALQNESQALSLKIVTEEHDAAHERIAALEQDVEDLRSQLEVCEDRKAEDPGETPTAP